MTLGWVRTQIVMSQLAIKIVVDKCHTTTPQGDGGAKPPKSKLMFNQPMIVS